MLVQDVNEYAPEWAGQPSTGNTDDQEPGLTSGPSTLRVEVEEGQLLEHVVQVEAFDRDCSPRFGDVCGYEILKTSASDEGSQQPFTINKDGETFHYLPYCYLPFFILIWK